MTDWFNFALYTLQKLVETVFDLDVGLGFSVGDLEVALLLIGVIATALIVRIGSFGRDTHVTTNVNVDDLRYGGSSYHEQDFYRS